MRPFLTAVLLAFLSAVFVFWQTSRVLPLFDYSYQIENAYRIAVGQVPYRDFILITSPLMHYFLALLMSLLGFSTVGPLVYMIVVSFAVVLLTYWLLAELHVEKGMRIYFLVPLVFAAHGIVPLPSYDVTATLFVLLSLGWLLRIMKSKETGFIISVLAGILLVLPALIKQNVGIAYLISAYAGMVVVSRISPKTISAGTILKILAGTFTAATAFILFLALSNALIPFIRQNRFVFLNRDPFNYGRAILIDVFFWKNLLIYLPLLLAFAVVYRSRNKYMNTIAASGAILFSFIFIPLVYFYLIFRQPIYTDFYFKLRVAVRYFFSVWYAVLLIMAVVVLVKIKHIKSLKEVRLTALFAGVTLGCTVAVSFLAQGVAGSTFGIYPFFILLLAVFYQECTVSCKHASWSTVYKTALIATSVFLMIFAFFNIRQSYVPVSGEPQYFSSRNLWHLGTPGPWVKEIDNMLSFVRGNIPYNQSVVALPGEDPFYFATKRSPQLRYFELFSGALPYTADRIAKDIIANNIDWLVVKTHLQSSYYMDTGPIVYRLKKCFVLFKQLPGYSIYRKAHPCLSGK